MTKLKPFELRKSSVEDLTKQLSEVRQELSQQRIRSTASNRSKDSNKIRESRKNVARVLTVMNQKRKAEARETFKNKKHIPLDLRPRLSRALRRKLTPAQAGKLTLRRQKAMKAFPKKIYSVAL